MDPNLHLVDWAGRRLTVEIDRPLGSTHPREDDIVYAVNYGFVPGTIAPDGHPIDVYVLDAGEPLGRCEATVIAIVRRRDDVEDKLVAVLDAGARVGRPLHPRGGRLPGALLRLLGGAPLTLANVRARLARLTPAEGARLCAPASPP